MKSKIHITGKAVFKKVGPGFWGIEDNVGEKWRPVNMPEQLKQEGAKIRCIAEKIDNDVSIFMWGVPIRIVSFHTINT
jgi:hypothetical protein